MNEAMKPIVACLLFSALVCAKKLNLHQPLNSSRPELTCEIEVRDAAEFSIDEFRNQFEFRQPVLIRGGSRQWPAQNMWTRQFLVDEFGKDIFPVRYAPDAPTDYTGPDSAHMQLSEVLSPLKAKLDNPPYLFHRIGPNEKANDILQKGIKMPIYFQNWLSSASENPNCQDAMFFFALGENNSGLSAHYHNEAWCAVIQGRKHWRMARREKFVGSAGEEDDEDRRQKSGASHWKKCTQRKGDLLYLPANWWHDVRNVGEVIAIAAQPSCSIDKRHCYKNLPE